MEKWAKQLKLNRSNIKQHKDTPSLPSSGPCSIRYWVVSAPPSSALVTAMHPTNIPEAGVLSWCFYFGWFVSLYLIKNEHEMNMSYMIVNIVIYEYICKIIITLKPNKVTIFYNHWNNTSPPPFCELLAQIEFISNSSRAR